MTHSNAYEQLDSLQLDGIACIFCGRQVDRMVPVSDLIAPTHRQLFACEDRIACAAAAEQLPGGYDAGEDRPDVP